MAELLQDREMARDGIFPPWIHLEEKLSVVLDAPLSGTSLFFSIDNVKFRNVARF
ncbi:MAG: hypothetical protein ABIP71_07790 [Verrucomicrobiota bacterium]